MKLYLSKFREKVENMFFKTVCDVQTLDDLREAVTVDHVAADFTDGIRRDSGFIQSDCIMMDLDNITPVDIDIDGCGATHYENPASWTDIPDIAAAFPDVRFYAVQSKNHMKEKNGKAPRPRYHFYFPLSRECKDPNGYADMMEKTIKLFPHFDVTHPARMFFGVADPVVEQVNGSKYLDEFLSERKGKQ